MSLPNSIDSLFPPDEKRLTFDHPRERDFSITPERCTQGFCRAIVAELDEQDKYDLNSWEFDFISNTFSNQIYSDKQRHVIYKMAVKYKLI